MYVLMNKDIEIALFDIVEQFGEEHIDIKQFKEQLMFSWMTNLERFILNRKAPKHREHIDKLMKQCGCESLAGFLDVTHALSLNDTFWIKKYDDKRLKWDNVSLYRNSFNETIAKIAFDGGLYGENFSSTSPEFGTDGMFAKCWVRENNSIKLIKRGSEGEINAGLEPYSEYYASQIINALGIKHVEYDLGTKHNNVVSKCNLFTSEKYGLVTLQKYYRNIFSISDLIKFYDKLGLRDYISQLLVVDSLIFNEDRHLGNLGFIFDNDTGKIVDTAPFYDHNISLLCYAMRDDFIDIRGYIRNNNKGHKMGGNSFEAVGRALMTPDMRTRLINISDFKFTRHKKYNLPEWRLIELEKLVRHQIKLLLQ